MTNKEILQADLLDILFEHRNKLYGAYVLRKTYSRRLGLALGVALSIVLLLILMSFIKKNDKGDINRQHEGVIKVTPLVIPEDKPKEPEPLKEKPKAQADFQKIIVVPDNEADTNIVKNDDLENKIIGDKNIDGDKPNDIVQSQTESSGTGDAVVKEPEKKDEPVGPTREPSFPGGPAAWLKFLQRILQAPEDIEPGKRIEVQIRFWVDIDGSVSRPEIIKSGGEAFDKEVLRVMKKMPKWEPALQAGRPIAVAYQQPVIFIGEEQ
ncbi:MAG TPA: TonB family protein [Chitinophagaceae bacterium]|jgi:protein TonB|nr:TonB family protein [Chitinophagaceae bacterium]